MTTHEGVDGGRSRLWPVGWRLLIATGAFGLLVVSVARELAPVVGDVGMALLPTVIAGVVGLPLWVWLLVARSRLAAPVAVGLDVMMVLVYWLSRSQPGVMDPPHWDWILVYVGIAVPTVVVALWFDRRAHRDHGASARNSNHVVAWALITGMVLLMCGFVGLATADRGFRPGSPLLGVDPTPEEIGTMADGLVISGVEQGCGSSGYCDLSLSIRSSANLSTEEIIRRLRRQLEDNGWRYVPQGGSGFLYAKEMGGILDWSDHRALVSSKTAEVSLFG